MEVDYSIICRTCHQPLNQADILSSSVGESSAAYKQSTISTLKARQNDGMPERVCQNCSNEESDSIVRELVSQVDMQAHVEVIIKEEVTIEEEKLLYPIEVTIKAENPSDVDSNDDTRMSDANPLGRPRCRSRYRPRLVAKRASVRYQCEECGKDFARPHGLKYHLRTHTGEKPFVCEYCQKSFKSSSELNRHRRIHTGEKASSAKIPDVIRRYRCEECGKDFARPHGLRYHLRTHTGEKPYVCEYEYCDKSFKSSSEVIKHRRTHTGEKASKSGVIRRYRCEECGQEFSQPHGLKYHVRTHTGEKPHVCEYCEKSFKSSSEVAKHRRIHTGEKPYLCEVCSRSFRWRDSLLKHLQRHSKRNGAGPKFNDYTRTHSDEKESSVNIPGVNKLHLCVCGREFTTPQGLSYHALDHTGEKPYACEYCQKSFKSSSEVINHRRIHTGEKPYICEVCSKSFRWRVTFTKHLKKHFESNRGGLENSEKNNVKGGEEGSQVVEGST